MSRIVLSCLCLGLLACTGPEGAAGVEGQPGEEGSQGEVGEVGPAGPKGDKGDKGDPGAPGAQGDKGDPGAPGAKGDKGDPGAPGDKGDKGDQGDPGPAFNVSVLARRSSNVGISGSLSKIVFNAEQHDLGGDYSTSTGNFTVPSSGVYHINCQLNFGPAASGAQRYGVYLRRNQTVNLAFSIDRSYGTASSNYYAHHNSGNFDLTAGDTVSCWAFAEPNVNVVGNSAARSFMSIHKISD